MKILYFSTSVVPSHFANSVNVMKMCAALAKSGNEVELVCIQGTTTNEDSYSAYGVQSDFAISTVKNDSIGILRRIISLLRKAPKADLVYTRYTVAAYICNVLLHKNVVYEYHAPAVGRINNYFEKNLVKSKRVLHVFITESLKEFYKEHRGLKETSPMIVLPDAADDPLEEINNVECSKTLSCGYIGSFQKGKGIDIVVEIANKLGDVPFHVVGGSTADIERLKAKCKFKNIIWYGFLPQVEAMNVLKDKIDIALLPNQPQVYVGKHGNVDIGKWTSPMKLFEYMSYGKVIIASDIGVLKEIIQNGVNALLVSPNDIDEWANAIQKIDSSRELANTIKHNAYNDFVANYTWDKRAQKLMVLINQSIK